MVSSVWMHKVVILMGVPGGMVYAAYCSDSSGAQRALRPVRPKERRLPSLQTADR